ncbi:hypothetical protein [Prevotella sp. MGM1]|uniref:hypothetical protein n=1 Tax=Prevotella sp. MGM1 TaxID=2033405 RepID=UPI000CEA1A62|nr:hypothetical protein [Prevotella sp. MGM1]GAY28137.1 hypothetical protein PvtlMGM1_1437 [Prevotella sp. MGM1]
MRTNHSKEYIAILIDRFMAGDTTVDEEQVLGDYFRTARDIPEEWKAYKDMFSYFDDGMRERRPPLRIAWPVRSLLTAAAVVLVLFGIAVAGWQFRFGEEQPRLSCNADVPAVSPGRAPTAGMESRETDLDNRLAVTGVEKPATEKSGGNPRMNKKNKAGQNRLTYEKPMSDRTPAASSEKPAEMTPEMIYAREKAECLAAMEAVRRADNNEVMLQAYEAMMQRNANYILVTDEDDNYKIVARDAVIVL